MAARYGGLVAYIRLSVLYLMTKKKLITFNQQDSQPKLTDPTRKNRWLAANDFCV